MRVAYIFQSMMANKILKTMILPQLEENRHGAEVVGMFFFADTTYYLTNGHPLAERLASLQREKGLLLMACDQCAYQREIQNQLLEGASIGCFPDLYQAIGQAGGVDQVITL